MIIFLRLCALRLFIFSLSVRVNTAQTQPHYEAKWLLTPGLPLFQGLKICTTMLSKCAVFMKNKYPTDIVFYHKNDKGMD